MQLDIAVIGAGIGGLAFAAMAHDDGHRVRLIERFDAPRPLGSGLVIQPVGLEVLDRIGAGAAVRGFGQQIRRMLGHEAQSGREVLNVRYRDAAPGLALHRSALFQPLWDGVSARGIPVISSATVIAAPPDGRRRRVVLEDGTSLGPFDLVVDASGAGSRLSPLKARPLPFGAIWGTVPLQPDVLPPDELRQRYLRAGKMMGLLPLGTRPGVAGPQAALFWSLPRAELDRWQDRPLDAWKDEARRLWPGAAGYLDAISSHDDMVVARYGHGTLWRPFAPGLAFLGDSGHRASPQLGQGANMALLDAHALARALRRQDPARALPHWARSRRLHLWLYQTMSAGFTPLYQSHSRALPLLRDHLLAPAARLPVIRGMLTALVSGDLIPPMTGWHRG